MYIVHSQNYEYIKKQENIWTEEFVINANKYDYIEKWSNVNELTRLKIRRIIQNGKFIASFEHINNLSEIQDIRVTYFINNTKVDFLPSFNVTEKKLTFVYNSDLDTKNKFDFEDLNNLNFEIEYKIRGHWHRAKRFTYWIKKNEKSKKILVNNKADIQVLSDIEITSIPELFNKSSIKHNFKTKYVNFSFKSIPLRQAYMNESLYELEISKINKENDDVYMVDNSDIYNLGFGDASLFNPFKEKYETRLKYKSFNKSEIVIDSYSYYDNQTNSVIVGQHSPYAKQGLLIPLRYSGIFGHEINFNIGKNLRDFKLYYSQNLDKPFFNLYHGLIKLRTKAIVGWLTKEKWHTIKYQNFSEIIKNADSLKAIEKMGEK